MSKRVLLIIGAVVLALVVGFGAGWVAHRPGPGKSVSPAQFASVTALEDALSTAGLGCGHRGDTIGPLGPGIRDSGTCIAGNGGVTLYTWPAGTLRPLDYPTVWDSVSWVVGRNWLVATDDRQAAVSIQHAVGGQLLPRSPVSPS